MFIKHDFILDSLISLLTSLCIHVALLYLCIKLFMLQFLSSYKLFPLLKFFLHNIFLVHLLLILFKIFLLRIFHLYNFLSDLFGIINLLFDSLVDSINLVGKYLLFTFLSWYFTV